MTAPASELTSMTTGTAAATQHRRAEPTSLPTYRLNIMRIGYLVMALGIAAIKWPIFIGGEAASLPAFEGVVAALLGMMGLLAFLGLRYPIQLLPLLLLEVGWKLIWFGAVAVPHLIAGDMSAELTSLLGSISVGVIIAAVTPWDYVWKRYVRAPGEPWR